MTRQYYILYKRGVGGEGKMARLQPKVHASLYERPAITEAIAYMASRPNVEGIALRFEDEQFLLTAFTQEASAPNSFSF